MKLARLSTVARDLAKPQTLARLVKTGVVLSAELALAPWLGLAAAVLPEGPAAERLLGAQNAFRQRALHWIFPEFR